MSEPRAAAGAAAERIKTPEDDPWLFTAEELARSPSRYAGVAAAAENECYLRAAIYIRECGGRLRLPALTIAVAGTFLRRFYMLESVTVHDMGHVASACLFLACKVSETHKRLREFTEEAMRVRMNNALRGGSDAAGDSVSPELEAGKTAMLKMEAEVLKILNFDLTVETPFLYIKHFNDYIRGLADREPTESEREERVEPKALAMQNAFNFLVESIGMYVHVRFDAREIATAAVYLGVRLADLDVCSPDPDALGYLDVFGCDIAHVEEIANAMMNATDPEAKFA